MFSSSVRCLYLMEIGLPGKVGLTCSKTCGNGSRIRVRLCNNPAPVHEGKDCEGEGKHSEDCLVRHCPGKSHFLRGRRRKTFQTIYDASFSFSFTNSLSKRILASI